MAGEIKMAQVVSSSNNIPTAFSAAAGSKIMTSINAFFGKSRIRNLQILNGTATNISWCTAAATETIPSSSTTERHIVLANGTQTLENVKLNDYIYIQSEGSAISSGTVTLQVW